MKKVGIIGGGFTGTMTAVQLIKQTDLPVEIIIINEAGSLNRGVAYNPYSKEHLLNVVTTKMSAFADQPNHFLNWIMARPDFSSSDENIVANAFMPRYLYGEYLENIWQEALQMASSKDIKVQVINDKVTDIDKYESCITVYFKSKKTVTVDYCVIATGNQEPANVKICNMSFYDSINYFKNSWLSDCVNNVRKIKSILIIGNGLTMVDTVLGLLENNYKGKIYSISPNGFNILPHRHNGLKYNKLVEELHDKAGLLEVFSLVHKHIKKVRKFGVSAEAVIDSIRPYTQQIWKRFSIEEKKTFMARFRHLWGVARHRIPLHIHDKLQKLRIEGRLKIIAGKLLDIEDESGVITVEYYNKKNGHKENLKVSRVINCSGPDSNIEKMDMNFLQNCFFKNIITQDELKLGILANTETFEIINNKGEQSNNLFTLGSNLRGQLWESTAVNELRSQSESLATIIIKKISIDLTRGNEKTKIVTLIGG